MKKIFITFLILTYTILAEEAIWNELINKQTLKPLKSLKKHQQKKTIRKPKLLLIGMDEEKSALMNDTARSLRGDALNKQKAHINSEDENVNYIEIKNQRDYNEYIAQNGELGTEIRNQSNKEIMNIVSIKNVKVDEGLFGVRITGSNNVHVINSVETKNVETIDDMEPEIRRDCPNENSINNRNLEVENSVSHDSSDVANSVFGVTAYEENCQ
ncbi:MAG: Unknown protein [uncultured Sulfurovum sp.]|uniref:Uncharacterized protein n=1 Tax=uncultured Sulfurovum sp. TaxID=269237 RepID=A0A6S6SEY1_9BACT|nr:MAG: Unknown protein [uncultured Sulfurovum sp.]